MIVSGIRKCNTATTNLQRLVYILLQLVFQLSVQLSLAFLDGAVQLGIDLPLESRIDLLRQLPFDLSLDVIGYATLVFITPRIIVVAVFVIDAGATFFVVVFAVCARMCISFVVIVVCVVCVWPPGWWRL